MSLLSKLSLKGSSKHAEAQAESTLDQDDSGLVANGHGAPPSYGQPAGIAEPPKYSENAPSTTTGGDPVDELNTSFASLKLSQIPLEFPDADQCLAHLKLLSAFHALQEDIGYTDGMFGLWDAKCDMAENRDEGLAKMREKRWALYIARAVERFEAWWLQVLCNMEDCRRLESKEMFEAVAKFAEFTKRGNVQTWTTSMLPPLDVLMVWHSFMLNPRDYLEDCIRFGVKDLWATGMPWAAIDAALDTRFNYLVPEEAQASFIGATGFNWDNVQDSLTNKLNCPRCSQTSEVPWTTCCANEKVHPRELSEMHGRGYGDRDLSHLCQGCGAQINHEFLRVGKFKTEVENVIMRDWPLGGTIISMVTGAPDAPPTEADMANWPGSFPNRLFRISLRTPALELIKQSAPTMDDVKMLVERAIADKTVVRDVNSRGPLQTGVLSRFERLAVRKMMTRHWANTSIFALDLGGAVVRQGVFVDKMYTIDWLHSPSARPTMDRLLQKYSRFIHIITTYSEHIAVPTLDVDLGWHTHQLSPRSYYDYTVSKCKKFIDHDDKMDEKSLSENFEWTSKTYETLFGEVYSECTCWYCEAIRSKHSSSAGRLFGNKHDKALNKFYESGAAQLCPPDKSAHISSHSAVQLADNPLRDRIVALSRKRHDRELEEAYIKACKRAKAKGRPIPPRNEYYSGPWGYPYLMYGPYMTVPMMGGVYFAGDPCMVASCGGMPGACAVGTCGSGMLGTGGACSGGTMGGVSGGGGGCGGGGCGGGGG